MNPLWERACSRLRCLSLDKWRLTHRYREQADGGTPTVVAEPASQIAATYRQIARTVAIKLSQLSLDHSSKFPNIVIQNT